MQHLGNTFGCSQTLNPLLESNRESFEIGTWQVVLRRLRLRYSGFRGFGFRVLSRVILLATLLTVTTYLLSLLLLLSSKSPDNLNPKKLPVQLFLVQCQALAVRTKL